MQSGPRGPDYITADREVIALPFLSVATNCLVNFVSRSCITMDGFSFRSFVRSMNISVCFTTHREFGRAVEDETMTFRVFMQRNTSRFTLRMPRAVIVFTEKKSQAHNVSP